MKLTPNRRLAIYLRGVPLNTWLEARYAELVLADPALPYRLSTSEEAVIWEKIIKKSDIGKTLLQTSTTARLARDAWIMSIQWQLSIENGLQTEDSLAYLEWASEYQALCLKENYVDSATFINLLIIAIKQKKILFPPEITLVGFEELTPQMAHFFEQIKAIGIRVNSEHLVSKSKVSNSQKIYRLPAANPEEELRIAVLKSKQWLEHHPEARIGIIIPELTTQRALVVRILSENFPLEAFNVAAPLPLIQYPLIKSALLALRFLLGEISLENFSRFLRSPFFGKGAAEQNIRSILDVTIREFSETSFSLENIIKKLEYLIQKKTKFNHFSVLESLQKLSLLRPALRGKERALFWRDRFLEMLSALCWPGDRNLTPEEIEIQQQWEKLLTDYVDMDRVLGEHRYSDALSYLQKLAQNTTFSPVSAGSLGVARGSAPIQVLGILEALGMPFDYCWVTGLHRDAWPTDPAPNPFIPLSLQRQYDLPRSSAARELKLARQYTERLSQSAKEVIFSYPTTIEEQVVLPSALITQFQAVTFLEKLSLKISKPSTEPIVIEHNLLENGPLVGKAEKIKGGSQVLKLQALCPFRAFAETRLQAKPLPTQSLGLNSAERGEIIHQVLDFFWQGLNNQADLLALPEETLNNRINVAIEKVLNHWQSKYPRTLTPQYLILEKERTFGLIKKFIELEKSRSGFEVVSKEKTGIINLENLEIKIRIDRIDRLADQSEILIDYKTGQVSISNWFGERPRDPQLPLYCVTREPKPAGIVFGIIRPDAVKFQGLVEGDEENKYQKHIPGVKTPEKLQSIGCANSLAEQREVWQKDITMLAREFMQGVARVEPLDGETTCRTCSLQALCRVHV